MIPRVIHHIWVGGPLPDDLRGHVGTWSRLHPGWEHRMWTADEIDTLGLVNRHIYDNAETIAPGSEGQLRADVARYEILHRFGGVYVDCDFECLRPIDPLATVPCFAAWETDGVWVNNAILGATAGHRLMGDAIAAIPASVEAHRGARPNKMTGPQMLTPLVGPDVTVYPSRWFYPYLWSDLDRAEGPFPDAFAVHHWANRRQRDGKPLPTPREVVV